MFITINNPFQNQYKGRSYLPVYIRLYVFTFEAHKIMKNHRDIEKQQRKNRGIPDNEPLPYSVYKTLPFSKFIEKTQLFSGCHSIFGNIALESGDFES